MTVATTYSIKLEKDGGIHPAEVPAGKLGELLRTLSRQFAGNDDDFCLAALADNCVRLDFKIKTQRVQTAILAFSAFLAGQTVYDNSAFLRNLAELDRVRTKFPGVSMTFPAVDHFPAVTIPPEQKIADIAEPMPVMKFEHTIYGKVVAVGGNSPNVHIRPFGGGNEVICDCSEELAREIAPLLYSVVGISGEATMTGDTMRMKAVSLLPYRTPTENPFTLLKNTGIGQFFEDETVEEFMNNLRGNDEDYHA